MHCGIVLPRLDEEVAMSILRSATKLHASVRQCARLVTAAQQQRRGYADMAFTFASPVTVHYEAAKVKQIDVPSFSGSFGILPDHVPLLAVLKPGVITVHEDDATSKRFFVSSGSVTVNDDSSVQILAEEAIAMENIDAQAVREGLNKATAEVNAASNDQAKAEALIGLECYEALQKAIEG
ncbi:hypothetical protein NP493_2g05048 [Ridgeia piscesae]|uniref:F-ATPase delta subunit n=1 Tax=Ridgeia piscesae TaxID=27915 RepID=A0AAD9PG91_RIDPI|nr:hypothetical protein NP493_2g05048 [Ridgeia piscesae]